MANRARQLTLRARLVLGLGITGLLVVVLLVLGERLLGASTQRLDRVVDEQVRPLVLINNLQSQAMRIRGLEIEMQRITDLFAMFDQAALLAAEVSAFDQALMPWISSTTLLQQTERRSLEEAWRRYQADLDRVQAMASAMDNSELARIGTFESAQRHRTIARLLQQAVDRTERLADAEFAQALREQSTMRWTFVFTSLIGLAAVALTLATLARHLTRRLSALTRAASEIAAGTRREPIDAHGHDELAALGAAFNRMQATVHEREAGLRAAQDQLERRVADRTLQLGRANAALQHQAQYDGLTGLPNRALVLERLHAATLQAQSAARRVVVMFLDLDDFKKVNDNFGHAAGDELLVLAAKRAVGCVRSDDTVARLGGDEFVIVLTDVELAEHARPRAEAVLAAFGAPFVVAGASVVVTPSLGLSVYPEDGSDAATLLRNADLAMYEAKAAGRNTFRFFDADVHRRATESMAIEARLREALPRGEFRLAWQALVDIEDGQLRGFEVLLRWHSSEGSHIGPDRFIPVAERTGLIVPIGLWVLDQALQQLAAWRATGLNAMHALHVGVNVSPRQFQDPSLVFDVAAALRRHGVPPQCLQIEVTEGLMIGNPREVQTILGELKALGVSIALDDFGTGYSSLSYLKRFPFDVVKIDREFVRDIAQDRGHRALVAAAVGMGRALELEVVAEGVETTEQLALLRSMGCTLAQGYLHGRPMAAEDFAAKWGLGVAAPLTL